MTLQCHTDILALIDVAYKIPKTTYSVIHDQVPAFRAPPLQVTLIYDGIIPVPITIKNPQADAICERFQLDTINNQVRTIFHSNPPQDIDNSIDVTDSAIASTVLLHKLRYIESLMFCHVAYAF